MNLSWIDYAIVFVYVGGTIVVGTLARGAIKGISDFLVAGRGLKTHMAVATMVSTGLGLVTVMYMAEEGFKYGFVPFVFGLMALITTLIIGRTGFIVSRLRHLQVMTVPEFYELKYTRGVRLLGGIILALAGTLNMGLFPILGSKFVVGFTGLDKEYVNYVMIGMLLIVVFYTLMGGMVSVVLTDFAQFVLLSLGFFFGTYVILNHPELGWDNLVQTVQVHKGDIGFDPIANPDYGISMISFLFFVGLVGVVWQPEMMRPLSAESPKVARRVFWIAAATVMGRAMVPMFWGIAALAYFGNPGADPHYAMPEMLGKILPIGIAGLLMAGMFAAFMSTHDSYLLAWSGVIVRDVVSPIKAMLAKSRRRARGRRHLGRSVERARDLLDSGHRRHPRRLLGHLRRALPTSRDGLPLYVRHRHHLLRRLRRHCRLGIVLEKGQYPGCVLCPDIGRAGAAQLPDHERKPALGARVFVATGRKLQPRRNYQPSLGRPRHAGRRLAHSAITPAAPFRL